MTSNRVMFVVQYEDGTTAEFSIDRWTLSLGDYAARIIARERQEKGDLPPGQIRAVRRNRSPEATTSNPLPVRRYYSKISCLIAVLTARPLIVPPGPIVCKWSIPMTGKPICAAALAATFAAISTPSAIAASFDGNWSVVAQTTQGHCGNMQFALSINRGRLYSGSGYYVFGYPAQLDGRVSPSGYVQANGVAGPRTAHAVGRLRQFQGGGTWAGSGPSGVCSGVWNAAPQRQTF
jgi:hypothetical protein